MIRCYNDFVVELLKAGFAMGAKADGIYTIVPWEWNEPAPYDTPVRWHTDDPETDPWVWRMRVLEERKDIAYAKLFFRKSGYITADWYPYFYAVRRGDKTFEDVYFGGTISNDAKRIYDVIAEGGAVPLHEIKAAVHMQSPEQKARFDKSLIDLQTGMFITMCARQQKVSGKGVAYGWFSTVFCLTEKFFGTEVFIKAATLSKEAAVSAIRAQVLKLNPNVEPKTIDKFIRG